MPRPSTREKLLDCAESLFAEQGLAGVSLRTINAEAGLSPAALHYHFKTKKALVEALLERRMPALMERRRALLDNLEQQEATPTTRDVLNIVIRPLVELVSSDSEAGQRYLRLIYRLQADGDLYSLFAQDRYSGSVDRLIPLLKRAMPDTSSAVLGLRLEWAIHLMLRGLAEVALLPNGQRPSENFDVPRLLLDFLASGFEARDEGPDPKQAKTGKSE